MTTVSRDNIVGIATSYGLGCPGIESRWSRGFPHPFRSFLGAPSLPYIGHRVNSACREAEDGVDHPLSSSAEVKGRVNLYL